MSELTQHATASHRPTISRSRDAPQPFKLLAKLGGNSRLSAGTPGPASPQPHIHRDYQNNFVPPTARRIFVNGQPAEAPLTIVQAMSILTSNKLQQKLLFHFLIVFTLINCPDFMPPKNSDWNMGKLMAKYTRYNLQILYFRHQIWKQKNSLLSILVLDPIK